MSSLFVPYRQRVKPPLGKQINRQHPRLKGCVMWYRMDERSGNLVDEINGRVGTINGNAWQFGQLGPELNFDGSDYVDVGANTLIGTEATYCFWLHHTGSGYQTLWGNGSNDQATFLTPTNTVECYNTSVSLLIGSASALPSAQYVHLAIAVSGTSAALYINGELDATSGGGSGLTQVRYLGTDRTALDEGLIGQLADFRLYNRMISASEARSLYQQPWLEVESARLFAFAPPAGGGVSSATASAVGTGSAAGDSRSINTAAGASLGTSGSAGLSSAVHQATVNANGLASVVGVARVIVAATGSSAGVSTGDGQAAAVATAQGVSAGVGVATGLAVAVFRSDGTSTGAASVNALANSVATAEGASTGLSAGGALIQAVAQATASASGVAAAQADATDASSGITNATAESQGASVATGISGAIVPAVAASAGGSAAAGLSATVATSLGNASGNVTVLGATRAVWTAVGAVAGTSQALGNAEDANAGTISATGLGAGSSTAIGLGQSIVQSVASAAGSSSSVFVGGAFATSTAFAAGSSTAQALHMQYGSVLRLNNAKLLIPGIQSESLAQPTITNEALIES